MLSKYSEARAFAYSQLEALMQQTAKAKPSAQSTAGNQLGVYKQLLKRDQKHWESDI